MERFVKVSALEIKKNLTIDSIILRFKDVVIYAKKDDKIAYTIISYSYAKKLGFLTYYYKNRPF